MVGELVARLAVGELVARLAVGELVALDYFFGAHACCRVSHAVATPCTR